MNRDENDKLVVKSKLGSARVINTFVPKEFQTTAYNPNFDIGVIKLASDLGKTTGFLRLNSNSSLGSSVKIAGYSVDKNGVLYQSLGKISKLTSNLIYYKNDTEGGVSGAPILNSNNDILGIHTKGNGTDNQGVRLTPELISTIQKWRDTPIYEPYKHDVVILKPNYNIYTDITLDNIVNTTTGRLDHIFKSTRIYKLASGYNYIDLCDSYKCYRVVNKNATVVLEEKEYQHKMKLLPNKGVLSKDIYQTYENNTGFLELTKSYYNKEVLVKHSYHKNGELLFYDVYTLNGEFLGYMRSIGLELVE